ncbi:MAG: hypothetical protein IJT88_06545 [Kiritimatiellae bacterium]|nr:hypothetical protein [Kiritimatiellia bacterium]
MAPFAKRFLRCFLPALVLTGASALAADGDAIGGGLETFDHLPYSTSRWDATTNSWTNAAGTAVWEAYNARASYVHPPSGGVTNPALSIRSTGTTASKGFWRTAPDVPLTGGVQRVQATFRQLSANAADCVVFINDTLVGKYVSSGNTNQTDTCIWETIDPATGLPFADDFALTISNRIATASVVAFDDVEWTPFHLFVTLDKPGTNVAYAADGEFEQPEFDLAATVHAPEGIVDAPVGIWSVEPDFAGTINDLSDPHLTIAPILVDAGKTFTFTYTATTDLVTYAEQVVLDPTDTNDPPTATITNLVPVATNVFAHSATAHVRVEQAVSPRFVDFEDMATMDYSAAETPVVLAGASWQLANARSSQQADPKRGARSLRLRHSVTSPALFASPLYPSGLGTLGFHFANYHTNHAMTLKVQTRGEDDDEEAWSDVEDGSVSFYRQMDIDDAPFRVDVMREGACAFRILSTESNGALANIDDVVIRAFGETDPVLRWDGSLAANADALWTGAFTYLHPTSDFEFAWSVTPPLAGLSATTNLEAGTLALALTPTADEWGEYVLEAEVRVAPDGVVDQRRRVTLSVGAWPSFALAPVATTVSNVVDIWVTNVVLHGSGTNWSVAWSAVPEFKGTNTVHNKSRYLVRNIADDDGPHVVTAVLTDAKTKWSSTQSVTIVVSGSSGGGGGDDPGPGPGPVTNVFYIATFTATNLVVTNAVPAATYIPFAVDDLAAGLAETNWTWQGAPTVPETDGTFAVPIPPPAAANPARFYLLRRESPDQD